MKFLTTTVFNGQEFALFLEEATGRVFRSPIYDMPAQQMRPQPIPMPTRDDAFHVPPAMPAFNESSPQPKTDLPDKPPSIMPAGLAAMMREGNEMSSGSY